MKIVFFGTANVALPVMEALRQEHEFLAVVTAPDAKVGRKQEMQESPVSALAQELRMPLYKPGQLKNNAEFYDTLKKLRPELAIVVDYGKILPPEMLSLPAHGSINIHPSILPRYRGPSPIKTALFNGDEYTGVSFILMDEQTDHGPLLAQQIVKIDPDDNNVTLSDKLARAAAAMTNGVMADYVGRKITPLPQDDSAATFTKHITKEHGKADWGRTAREIYNQFRAFYPWPGLWTKWGNKVLKITDCSTTKAAGGSTGEVLQGGVVACGGNSFLKINQLQLEGKNETDINSFLNGYKDFIGAKLE